MTVFAKPQIRARDRIGKAAKRINENSITAKNGSDPLKIESTETSGSFIADLTVKTESPNGGVSNPISTAITVTIPK